MNLLLSLFKNRLKTPYQTKKMKIVGSGAAGIVYDFDASKILKVAKYKKFNDAVILADLQGIESFPILYDAGENWYVAEKFIGENFDEVKELKKDWKEVFLCDVAKAFDKGWEIQDLKADNLLIVDGYLKMFDVGMFTKSEKADKEAALYWANSLLDYFDQSKYDTSRF